MGRFAQFLALRILAAYKWAVSPLFLPACRYVPTCSEYATEAVERYGAVRGGLMGLWRLLRCHPFARGGYDPVVSGEGRHFSRDARERETPEFAQGLKPNHLFCVNGAAESRALPTTSGNRAVWRDLRKR